MPSFYYFCVYGFFFLLYGGDLRRFKVNVISLFMIMDLELCDHIVYLHAI